VLGPDHPDTLATRHNLAQWQGKAGDEAGAATAFEDLLAGCLRVLGPDHPSPDSATCCTGGCRRVWTGVRTDLRFIGGHL